MDDLIDCLGTPIYPYGRMGGGVRVVMHGRSRMTIDPGILIMPGQSTSGIHRPVRYCLHQAPKRRTVSDESYGGWAASYQEPFVRRTE